MSAQKATNVYWHQGMVSRKQREAMNLHRGVTLWFTGLSAAGKSTLAVATEAALFAGGCRTYILDGDNIRHGLNKNLGFSPEDRSENIRRIGEVARLFTDCGIMTLTAFISPYRKDRDMVRALYQAGDFIEVFVDCPLSICEQRDPKGMYQKARAGQIRDFTGVDAPYEPPLSPEIHLDTGTHDVSACVALITDFLRAGGYVCSDAPAAAVNVDG